MAQDSKAPEFKTLNLSYQADQNRFNFSAQIEDDNSGIKYAYVYIKNPSGTKNKSASLQLNISTNLYEGSIQLDQYAESGEWKISYLWTYDHAENKTIFSDMTGII